ncbi:P12 family lipoprotein [Borreliella bissettiae]|uniref:P12 family lipoprotein n=1 Tax=Borrelia bissettiae TaxID=64897 RepID=UPI0026477892|nr:P12 family lipoprotein [Borreliella bissettiae]WKD00296.1 P12 family lipoprotein [Borreliella bissettiae]
MKKIILVIYMLMLLILLSCNTSSLNELMSKTKEKFIAKKEDSGSIKKTQKDEKIVEQYLEEREKQIVQADPVESVNAENLVILNFPYYPQKEIEIKEEDLSPSTDEEKEAEKVISDVKSALVDLKFSKLINDEHKLKNEYEQLESSFHTVYYAILELKNKLWEHLRQNNAKKHKHNNIERQKLTQLGQLNNNLNKKRADIDELRIKLESGLNERTSAKYFFEKAQKTLKEAIAERLKNKHSNWSRKKNSNLLAKKARNEAESALRQLETSSIAIGQIMGRKKEVEELIQEAKSVLANFKK